MQVVEFQKKFELAQLQRKNSIEDLKARIAQAEAKFGLKPKHPASTLKEEMAGADAATD